MDPVKMIMSDLFKCGTSECIRDYIEVLSNQLDRDEFLEFMNIVRIVYKRQYRRFVHQFRLMSYNNRMINRKKYLLRFRRILITLIVIRINVSRVMSSN